MSDLAFCFAIVFVAISPKTALALASNFLSRIPQSVLSWIHKVAMKLFRPKISFYLRWYWRMLCKTKKVYFDLRPGICTFWFWTQISRIASNFSIHHILVIWCLNFKIFKWYTVTFRHFAILYFMEKWPWKLTCITIGPPTAFSIDFFLHMCYHSALLRLAWLLAQLSCVRYNGVNVEITGPSFSGTTFSHLQN